MKTINIFLSSMLVVLHASILTAVGQCAFTYRGQLQCSGAPATGLFDLQFTLHNGETAGPQIGPTVTQNAVPTSNGLFTVSLDFGAGVFDGSPRWLQIWIKSNSAAGEFTALTPRQRITPTAESIFAQTAGTVPAGSLTSAQLAAGAVAAANIADGQVVRSINLLSDAVNLVAGEGLTLNTAGNTLELAAAPPNCNTFAHCQWNLLGNSGITSGTSFLGTTAGEMAPLEFRVNNTHAMRFEPGSGTPSIIGGYSANAVTAGVIGATISGGGESSLPNAIGGNFATIGGGRGNVVGPLGADATIGGGLGNRIGFGTSASTIAGGESNVIGKEFQWGTISGGRRNQIIGNSPSAAIGGGENNLIGTAGQYATIPGGRDNHAVESAFAAGTRAKAISVGSFVWADSTDRDIASNNENSVTMRGSGGYRLFSDPDATVGAHLASGSGSWTSLSDRNAKENFETIDPREVLDKVAALPVQRWNYKTQAPTVRHIGPTAQDFKSAFHVGESDTGIATVDANGVALAAIQGLNQKLEEQLKARDAEIRELRAVLKTIQTQLADLKPIPTNLK